MGGGLTGTGTGDVRASSNLEGDGEDLVAAAQDFNFGTVKAKPKKSLAERMRERERVVADDNQFQPNSASGGSRVGSSNSSQRKIRGNMGMEMDVTSSKRTDSVHSGVRPSNEVTIDRATIQSSTKKRRVQSAASKRSSDKRSHTVTPTLDIN